MTRRLAWRSLVLLPLLAGCDQRILGEFGYDGHRYRASYEATVTLNWNGHTITSRRYVDEFEQTFPPDKGYISYSYNSYVTLDADTVAGLDIGHNGVVNTISIQELYQRDIGKNGQAICRHYTKADLVSTQFSPSIATTLLKTRPPSDRPVLNFMFPPNEAGCSALIAAGQSKTEISARR